MHVHEIEYYVQKYISLAYTAICDNACTLYEYTICTMHAYLHVYILSHILGLVIIYIRSTMQGTYILKLI